MLSMDVSIINIFVNKVVLKPKGFDLRNLK